MVEQQLLFHHLSHPIAELGTTFSSDPLPSFALVASYNTPQQLAC